MSDQIFLGRGTISMAESYELHRVLEEALSSISGLQQGLEEVEAIDAQFILEIKAAYIYTKLTGRMPPVDDNVKRSVNIALKLPLV